MSEPLDLEAIRERAANATEGPWVTEEMGHLYVTLRDERGACKEIIYMSADKMPELIESSADRHRTNAEFIAHARTDVPALVAEVERLRANNAELVALIQPILDRTEGQIGTHSSRCFEYHVACLAHLVRERLA